MPLSQTTPIEDWIKDFQESDDPKFNGKSKEKRREMAIAAYYSSKKDIKESLEELITEKRTSIPVHQVKVIHTGEHGAEAYTDYINAKTREEAESIAAANARKAGKKNPIVVKKPSEYKGRKEYQIDFSHEKKKLFGDLHRVNDSMKLHAGSSAEAKSKFEQLAAEGKLQNHKIRQIFRT
jgi:hypothetical protein